MEATLARVAREIDTRRYGKYRGFVLDNKDPQKRCRVKLRVPSVLGSDQETDWALPCLPFGGKAAQGLFLAPEVDSQVWVEFEEGDISRPIWVGSFWQGEADVPEEAALEEPTTRMLKTPGEHVLLFNDKDGEERILLQHKQEAKLEIDSNGTVVLSDAKENKVTLDAENNQIVVEDAHGNTLTMSSSGTLVEDKNGNKIEMAAAGITVKGQKVVVEGSQVMLGGEGGEPIIKGQSFLSLFMTHVHGSAMGPTSPPVPQGEMSSLSMKVMTS